MTEEYLSPRYTWLMLAVVLLATLMDGLDGSIVTVANPDIGKTFGVDTATVSWVVSIYFIVLAGSLIFFAKIADNHGVRNVMISGLVLFTIGSALCGLENGFPLLIASRALQGFGAAMMAATGPMCCVKYLPPRKLAFGLAVITVGSSVGFAVGPGLGGLIVEYLSWHWVFFINIPLGIITILLAVLALPREKEHVRSSIDWSGAALLATAIVLGIMAVEMLSYADRRMFSAASGLACLLLLVLFARHEGKTARPLLNVQLFRNLSFSGIFLCLLFINLAYMGIWYLMPFYGEIEMGLSSAEIGTFLLVSALVTACLGMPIARLSDRYGRRQFCIAAAVCTGAAFTLSALFSSTMSLPLLAAIMVLMGLGWAFVGGPMASWLVEHASGPDRDMASSLINEAYYTGGGIGTALFAALFAVTSGSEGIDISAVSGETFVSGFIPCCLLGIAVCLAIGLISAAVRNGKTD